MGTPPRFILQSSSRNIPLLLFCYSIESAVPREPIARDIVKETLKRSPRAWIWGGANAWLTWFISTFFNRTAFVGGIIHISRYFVDFPHRTDCWAKCLDLRNSPGLELRRKREIDVPVSRRLSHELYWRRIFAVPSNSQTLACSIGYMWFRVSVIDYTYLLHSAACVAKSFT